MATAALIGGTAVMAMGQQYQGQATQAAYEAQASLSDAEALYQARLGEIEAASSRREAKQAQSSALVAGAVSGLDTSSGSFLDVIGENAKNASINEQLIKYGAKIKSQQAKSQANIYRASGSNAMTAANISTIGTMLTGGASSAQSYSKFGWGI